MKIGFICNVNSFYLCAMTPQELKEYFDQNPPPFEIDWKPWAKIINSKVFLTSSYKSIERFKGNYQQCPSYWHLLELYHDFTEKAGPISG